MTPLALALDQIAFARRYTLGFLDGLDPADWFRMPAEGVTHIAWQVGHLAFAQYRLALERVRGVRPDVASLITPAFLQTFGRDSVPDPDPARYPPVAEIRRVLDAVHVQVMRDLADHPADDLANPPLTPHRLARTKLDVLLWCGQHELVHAGQIALLRRLSGRAPRW
jgi:hypothetical protein